jgi:uncharacterized peroxidase-related enzyme
MSYLTLTSPEQTTGTQKQLFDQIKKAFGVVPNMFKTIGNSPAALESMWSFFGALGKGKIDAKLGEQIAVLVADLNRCEYCLAAHTALGQKAGLSLADMAAAQAGESKDRRTQAALSFAKKIVVNKGQLSKNEVDEVKSAGFSEEETAEILAHVALNIFTNYTNIVFDVPVDFPKIKLR